MKNMWILDSASMQETFDGKHAIAINCAYLKFYTT